MISGDTGAKRWEIRHETVYRYSAPVVFAPHLVRLTPRPDRARCSFRSLHVQPTPVTRLEFEDSYGNACVRLGFGPESARELLIDSRSTVEVSPPAPKHSSLLELPWEREPSDSLAAFRSADPSPEVASLAARLLSEVGADPLVYFGHLNLELYSKIDRQIRLDGHAQTPAETLSLGRGACRDLTVLFLAVCRSLGVASRFVSGYQGQEASPDGKRHLHAWPEVFVPQLGWRGWDPTHGVAVGVGHVAVCAAPAQAETMPIEGGFYSDQPNVESTLSFSITVDPA